MDETGLGERELEVMAWLWANESGTVNEVRDALDAPLAYTTVLTILRNLESKGYLRREEEGRAHRYFPRVQQRAAQKRVLRRVIDSLFRGSPEALLAHLVDDHAVSPDELRRVARRLSGRKRSQGGDA